MSSPNSIDTGVSIISRLNDQVVEVRFKDGVHVKMNHAIEMGEATLEVSGREKFLLLIDASDIFGIMDPDAMDHFTHDKELVSLRMAQAMVVNNLPLKLLANFYMRVKKPPGDVQVFNQRDEALAWLDERKHLLTEQ